LAIVSAIFCRRAHKVIEHARTRIFVYDDTPQVGQFGHAPVQLLDTGHAARPRIRHILENNHVWHMQFE
jgi:hypothetical protein